MTKPLSEKEKLLSMLSGVYIQLEELETVLEATFSDQRNRLNNDELNKITVPEQRLAVIKNEFTHLTPFFSEEVTNSIQIQASRLLKLELGY